jgi:hypothetical protein
MYEFYVINRNWICVAQLLKAGEFSKIDHQCNQRDDEGKPRIVEMTLTKPVPTRCNCSTILSPRNELLVRLVDGSPSSRVNEEMG